MSDHGAAAQPAGKREDPGKPNAPAPKAHPVDEAAQEEAAQDRTAGGGYT